MPRAWSRSPRGSAFAPRAWGTRSSARSASSARPASESDRARTRSSGAVSGWAASSFASDAIASSADGKSAPTVASHRASARSTSPGGRCDANTQRARFALLGARLLVEREEPLDRGAGAARVVCLLERARRVELGARREARRIPLAGLGVRAVEDLCLGAPAIDVRSEQRKRRLQAVEERKRRRAVVAKEGHARPDVTRLGARLVGRRQRLERAPGGVPLLVANELRPRRRLRRGSARRRRRRRRGGNGARAGARGRGRDRRGSAAAARRDTARRRSTRRDHVQT